MARPSIADLMALTDEELKTLSADIADEIHRRDDVARLPAEIEELTQRFVDRGGPVEKLKNPQSYTRGPKGVPRTPEGIPIDFTPKGKTP